MSQKTKKPSGLAVARGGYKFLVAWKISDKDYNDGQTFQYKVGKNGKWVGVSIGKTTTQKELNLQSSITSGTTEVSFQIRGNRKSYTEVKGTSGKGKNKLTVALVVNPTVSDWASITFPIKVPNVPSVSSALGDTWNKCTYSFSVVDDDKKEPTNSTVKWYTGYEWQSILLYESNASKGEEIDKFFNSNTAGWATYSGTAASGSWTKAEDTMLIAGHSYTRWFRCRSVGIAGKSAWAYTKHVFSDPPKAEIYGVAKGEANSAGGTNVKVIWKADSSNAKPIDSVTAQYVVTTPGINLSCPAGTTGWQNISVSQTDTSGLDAISSSIPTAPGLDECMFVRVNTKHDNEVTEGTPALAKVGVLKTPTNLSVTDIDSTTHKVNISVTNASSVEDSFMIVKFQSSIHSSRVIGIIPHGQSSITGLQCPNWGTSNIKFTVQAVVGNYILSSSEDGASVYSVFARMESATQETGGTVPQPPAANSITLSTTDILGTIRVAWAWSWSDANVAELSWADRPDAWESTDEPSKYLVSSVRSAYWNIAGLETGKVWYVRIRLGLTEGDKTNYSEYSVMKSINLASAPAIPALYIEPPVATVDGNFTASWGYVSTDGTPQATAHLALVTESNGENVYTLIAHTQTAQHISMNVKDMGWTAGNRYGLAVKVVSASGQASDDWSPTAFIDIAEPVEAEISQTSLITQTVDGRTFDALTEMPLTVTVTGAGVDGTTVLAIERTQSYHVYRPDESELDGQEGETIYIQSMIGEGQFTINNEVLIGRLDDGAHYRLAATVKDSLGQTDEAFADFEVHWTHQAVMPNCSVIIDDAAMVAELLPIAPSGVATGDVCDIYRLSADKPVLIYQGATFGEKYVDPYPTIGDSGGYRFVFRTKNGDYITAENQLALVDQFDSIGEEDYNIIDFGAGRVILTRNIDFSSNWQKDFQETKYLGGAVQGDWNPAVSRSSSLSAKALTLVDEDTIEAMRRLAVYSGICHVRTKEGSNFTADVQVKENYTYATGFLVADFSMDITRVDPEELDGMTYADWIASQARGQT